MKRKIDRRNEDLQRLDILRVSRDRDGAYLPELLQLLQDPRTPQNNRRHIIRALGRLGDRSATPALLSVLQSETGAILGDTAEALGKLGALEAVPILRKLIGAEEQWIAQNATRALRMLQSESNSKQTP